LWQFWTTPELKHFHSLATEAGLAVLVEAHDDAELDRAIAAGAQLIGINNRDLKTFKVDLGTNGKLAGSAAAVGSHVRGLFGSGKWDPQSC
jgi:indole-3-glycerol phosphate synthase